MFSSLKAHLLIRIFKNETSYILSSMIMFISLFFILFTLFMSKEIFIHYSDSNSMLLPKSLIVVDDSLSDVKKILKQRELSDEKVLLAETKNYQNLSIYSNINRQKSLPKDFTLLSFDIDKSATMSLECGEKKEKAKILDISLKRHKDWVFKLEKLSQCKPKEPLFLITPDAKIELEFKRNRRYAKVVYRANLTTDKFLYPYLIKIEESLFINYFAYSKFFVAKNSMLSKETQEHAKMLNSLFKIIYANGRRRAILNHASYSFLTEYKKIPFTIKPLNRDFKKPLTILDELALNITNDKSKFSEQLLIVNNSSLKGIKYDKTLIFSDSDTLDETIFTNPIKISRDDFNTVKGSSSAKINITIYLTLFILFILMLALMNSFITRNYKLYKETFSILIFHGFEFKIVTLVLFFMLSLAFMTAYIITSILLNEVNNIFDLYYVDLIRLNFEYNYILGFFILSLIASYLYELKAQNRIINKAKGR